MKLKHKFLALLTVAFLATLGASYLVFALVEHRLVASLGTLFAERQVLYNRERSLHPLMRELTLARKLADSSAILAWSRDERNPALRAAALRELEDYRRFFSDRSYFFVIDASRHYYFNDRTEAYTDDPLRYTLDPGDPEDRWYFATVSGDEPYRLNVDHDEKLGVTKVWMNVVVRGAEGPLGVLGTGIDLSDFLAEAVASDQPGVSSLFIEDGGAIQAHEQVDRIDFRTISKAISERKTVFQLLDSDEDRARLRWAMDRLKAGQGEVEVLFAGLEGTRHLVGLAHLHDIGWYSLTIVDVERVIGANRFLPFAALVLTALLLDRVVLGRLARLDRSMRSFAQGSFPDSAPPAADDEIGRLEDGFQKMSELVGTYTAELEHRVGERTRELVAKNEHLDAALKKIETLSGLLPICAYCKKIRDTGGSWHQIESYVSRRTRATFSHGVCPDCAELHYPRSRKEGPQEP